MKLRISFLVFLAPLLAACGFGVVDTEYEFPAESEGALLVYFQPEELTAWFRQVELASETFSGKKFTVSDPNLKAGTLLLWYQDDRKSDRSTLIQYRDTNGNVHYFGDKYRGFTFKVVPAGDFAMTHQYKNKTAEWVCHAERASVFRIEPGKANLVIGELQRPIPTELLKELKPGEDISIIAGEILEPLRNLEATGQLDLSSIRSSDKQLVLGELKQIMKTYPNFKSDVVLANKVADIAFEGKDNKWIGGTCPKNSTTVFKNLQP